MYCQTNNLIKSAQKPAAGLVAGILVLVDVEVVVVVIIIVMTFTNIRHQFLILQFFVLKKRNLQNRMFCATCSNESFKFTRLKAILKYYAKT